VALKIGYVSVSDVPVGWMIGNLECTCIATVRNGGMVTVDDAGINTLPFLGGKGVRRYYRHCI